MVAVGLQAIPEVPFLPEFATEAKADPPTLSGSEPAYPLNHTIDGEVEAVGDPLPNASFEDPSEVVGSPPENADLEDDPVTLVTPDNHDLETGTFSGWTITSDPTIQTTSGDDWAQLGDGDAMTSSALTVPSDAQAVAYNVNYTTTAATAVRVYALSGTGFSTSTQLLLDTCTGCGYWDRSYADITAFAGQQIKLHFSRYQGVVGIDDVSLEETFPGFTLAGNFSRETDGAGNDYVKIGSSITTADPIEVAGTAQRGTVRLKGVGSNPGYYLRVAVGPSFSTYNLVSVAIVSSSVWTLAKFDLGPYLGQDIKIRVSPAQGGILADDLGLQIIEVPEWEISGGVALVDDGAGNHYTRFHGSITSGPIEVPAAAHNLVLEARTDPDSGLYQNVRVTVTVLYGSGYSQTSQLDQIATTNSWETYRYGVGKFAGQTVKLRIETGSGTADVDDTLPFEQVLPGWVNVSGDAIASGEDANGSYVYAADGGGATLRSSWINTGVMGDSRTYKIGFLVATCGACIYRVNWTNASGGSWIVLSTSTPQGVYRESRIPIYDWLGSRGYFTVEMVNGGRLYSIGDNVARQHMSEPFSSKVGMGIDTTTGAVAFSEQDVSLPGALPLVFARYYNSHSDRFGTLGYRWSHTYDTRIELVGSDAAVVFGSGREEFFDEFVGDYTAVDPRVHSTLDKETDGTFTYRTKDLMVYRFTSAGRLTSIEDLNGNAIELTYDGQGLLTRVDAPGGRAIDLTYQSGRLVSVTDPLGAVFMYAYDGSSDLVSVTDPEIGERTYTYEHHRLATVTDQEGNQVVQNVYDDFQRVTSQANAAADTIEVTYDTPGKGATEVTDPEGGVSTFYFDTFHRTTDAVDPTSNQIGYVFDGVGNLETVIDPAFNEWTFDFDNSGDLLELLDPLANPASFTYNAKHLPTTVTDGRGNTTTLAYDGDGNLVSSTDPLDRQTAFTYDAGGNMTARTDPLDNTWTYTYDGDGHKTSETDPLDFITTFTYDAAGRLKTEEDALGATTRYFYDLLGRLILIRDPLDRETEFLYDAVGHLIRVTDPEGAETLWDYDERGLVEAKTDANGDTWTYTYDDNGRMTSITDPLEHSTTWAYDDAGRLVSETDPLGNATTYAYDTAGRLDTQTDALDRETTYTYDEAARVTSTTLANGATVGYTYDEAGNLTVTTDALGNDTVSAYDEANQLVGVTDPLLNETTYTYDDAGRRTSQTDPLGNTTTSDYDDAGRLVATTDPLNHETTFTLDDVGQIVGTTDATGRETSQTFDLAGQLVASQDGLGNETTYSYDLAGRLTSVILPSGPETTYTYDALGNRTSVTDPLANGTTYVYDDAGRLISETDPLANPTTYAYDAAGRMISLTDALGGVVGFGYDDAGQLTSLTDPRDETWTYTYDELGNRASITDPLANVTGFVYDERGQLIEQTDGRGVQTEWTYDERGLPEGVSFPGGSVSYGYDDAGRRTSMTDATGTTSWTFDDAGRVTAAAAPAGTIGYGHDDAGRRTSMTLPGGREIGYGYDLAGRLTSMVDPSQDEIAFGYDEDGRRATIERPNGVDSTTTYDDAGRVTSIAHAGTGGTIVSFAYAYDDAGRRTSVTTAAGTETYVHDDLGQLIAVEYADGEEVSYTYDEAGNRLTETRDDITTTYSYDDASRLTQVGATAYTYDDAGNLIGVGADEFTYDYGNRLVTASVGGHDATYIYDGVGVRVGTDVDTSSNELLVDRESGLPTVVDDGDAAYLDADGLIEASGTSSSFPLLDALGSVRSVTSSTGTVTAISSYEAFGAVRAQTGNPTGFGFTGEPTDATGLVYLRARTLDPATARFLQADSVRPGGAGTVGYNLYAYAANNPTTWTDPTGHFQQSLFGMGSIVLAWELLTGESAGLLATLAAHPVVLGIVVIFVVAFAIVACNLIDTCHDFFVGTQQALEGGSAGDIQQPVEGDLSDAPTTHPGTPVPPIPPSGGPGSANCDEDESSAPVNLRHYTTEAGRLAIQADGEIRIGLSGRTFLTSAVYATATEAQADLALPRTPAGYFEVPRSRLGDLRGPTCVQPQYGQPGGGTQYWVTSPISAQGLTWVPINP